MWTEDDFVNMDVNQGPTNQQNAVKPILKLFFFAFDNVAATVPNLGFCNKSYHTDY